MPTLADSDIQKSAAADNTTLTSKSFTAANGDVFVVKLATWDTGNGMAAPTGGAQTWHPALVVAPGGFNGWCAVYTATVSGSPGSFAVASAPGTAGNTRHTMIVQRWTSAKLAATPAVNGTVSGTSGGASGPSVNITTAADNSALSWVSVDEASQDPASRAFRLSATEDGIFDGHLGSNSVHYFAYASVGAAGTYAIGMTAPVSQTFVIGGVEIQAGSSTVSGSGSTSLTTGQSAAATVRVHAAATTAATTGDTTTGRVRVRGGATTAAATTASSGGRVRVHAGGTMTLTTDGVLTTTIGGSGHRRALVTPAGRAVAVTPAGRRSS